MWQLGNPRGSVVFEFRLGRGGAAADSFLAGYKGILQTDGYAGYDNTAKGVGVHAGCWAHLRRYFVDAVKVNKLDAVAAEFVAEMDKLFAVDREAAEAKLTAADRYLLRREKAAPIVEKIREKLLFAKNTVLPKSKLGEAIAYALAQWQIGRAHV